MADTWQPGDPLPGVEPAGGGGASLYTLKFDHSDNCRTCQDGNPSANAARWPEPYFSDDLDVLDRTAEVARGTR